MPSTTASKALLEINGLRLFQYNSIYGHAFEVLTQDGKNRVAHGEDEEAVLKKAVEYLEARAVLTGKPVRPLVTAGKIIGQFDAFKRAFEKDQQQIREEILMKEAQRRVYDQPQFPPNRSVLPNGGWDLDKLEEARRSIQGSEPKKKI